MTNSSALTPDFWRCSSTLLTASLSLTAFSRSVTDLSVTLRTSGATSLFLSIAFLASSSSFSPLMFICATPFPSFSLSSFPPNFRYLIASSPLENLAKSMALDTEPSLEIFPIFSLPPRSIGLRIAAPIPRMAAMVLPAVPKFFSFIPRSRKFSKNPIWFQYSLLPNMSSYLGSSLKMLPSPLAVHSSTFPIR